MSDALAQLEPRSVWGHFASIAAIPRPSKHEEKIVGWIRSLAEEHGFTARSDRAGNLVVDVPASEGCERAPTVGTASWPGVPPRCGWQSRGHATAGGRVRRSKGGRRCVNNHSHQPLRAMGCGDSLAAYNAG